MHTNINDFINESLKTTKSFYDENNIIEDDLSYLGSGDFGEAYSIGDGRVLKKTSSKSEFEIAKELENTTKSVYDCFAKIYKTEIIEGNMLIILEELDTDSEIENLYYELESLLSEQGLPIQYLDMFDEDEVDTEISDELNGFMNGITSINHGYRNLGIEASDIRPENLGYSEDGELKAFDIEDKQKNR